MKKFKLGIVSLLTVAMLTTFTACGNANTTDNAVGETTQAETTEEVKNSDDAQKVEEPVKDTTDATTPVSKNITVEVADKDGNVTSYETTTDAEFLLEAVEAMDDVTIEGTEGDYGLYIESVNGVKADYETDGAYWSIYVNGEYGSYSVSEQPVNDGDTYRFAYEIYVAE